MTTDKQVIATARDAGRNVVHTVTATRHDGTPAEVVQATRRSAHRYRYAICEWVATVERDPRGGYRTVRDADGFAVKHVVVRRWSRNPKATGGTFAVPVVDEVKR